MLHQLPAELCARIFDFACRDSGSTGRSLSLVSRYINATSQSAKLQSIALVGRQQILGFAALLDRTPTHLRTTRCLFVNGQETEAEMELVIAAAYRGYREAAEVRAKLLQLLPPHDARVKALDEEVAGQAETTRQYLADFGAEGAQAMESILRALGPTLELLDLALNEYVAKMLVSAVSLPRLVDFTTRSGFPLHPTDVPVLAPCPSLRRLHIVETPSQWTWTTRFFENGISHFAPALTHLRLSEINQDEDVINYLEGALGLCTPLADPRVTPLPATVEMVLIKPGVAPPPHEGCSCCDDTVMYYDLLRQARRLRDKALGVVMLLRADARLSEQDVYFQEWMEKAEGAPCRWDTSSVDEQAA
ncbi:hypothetical protein FB451DRAFT_1216282 [Mycena latifolia]|nr:hypothetical protein FB451DRAFT_1216282 [Mycena latifolia]